MTETTIKASEAVFGEWYRSDRWGIVRCADVEREDQLPMFISVDNGQRSAKYLYTEELTHLPDCDSFEWEEPTKEPDNPNGVRWFVKTSHSHSSPVWCGCDPDGSNQVVFVCELKDEMRSTFEVPLKGDYFKEIGTEEALGRIAESGWTEGVARARELAGLRPAITEGSVWSLDGEEHVVVKDERGWIARHIGKGYGMCGLHDNIDDVFTGLDNQVQFVRPASEQPEKEPEKEPDKKPKIQRWNSVEPGDGWRLIRPGENFKPGDQFYIGHNGWEDRTCFGGVHDAHYCPQRRRIDSETPDPGNGWRLIDPSKDHPHEEDEMWGVVSERWVPRAWEANNRFAPGIHYRRKVSIVCPDPGEGYRLIDPKVDSPAAGDEMWCASSWMERMSSDDQPFAQCITYRRRIDFSEWQEPVGFGGTYPLPVGTVVELKDACSKARITDHARGKGECNATWERSGNPVSEGGGCRWRVVPDSKPETDKTPGLSVGDWVRSNRAGIIPANEIARVEKIRDGIVTVAYMGGNMRTTTDVGNFHKPEYRPFADASEFTPYRDKWLKNIRGKAEGTISRVTHYNDTHVNGIPYTTLMYCRVFEDGTPCGIEVVE